LWIDGEILSQCRAICQCFDDEGRWRMLRLTDRQRNVVEGRIACCVGLQCVHSLEGIGLESGEQRIQLQIPGDMTIETLPNGVFQQIDSLLASHLVIPLAAPGIVDGKDILDSLAERRNPRVL